MIDELKEYAISYQIPIILDDALAFIRKLIKDNNCVKVLEIGSAIGYSALGMIQGDDTLKIVTVEKDEERYLTACMFLKKYDHNHQITIYHDDALTIDLDLIGSDFDLIFIDAAKAKNLAFFKRFMPLLSKTGIIVTDNINFHNLRVEDEKVSKRVKKMLIKIKEYQEYLKTLEGFSTQFLLVGDGLAVTKRQDVCD